MGTKWNGGGGGRAAAVLLAVGGLAVLASPAAARPLTLGERVAKVERAIPALKAKDAAHERALSSLRVLATEARSDASFAAGFIDQCLSAIGVNSGTNGEVILDTSGSPAAYMVLADPACVRPAAAAAGRPHIAPYRGTRFHR